MYTFIASNKFFIASNKKDDSIYPLRSTRPIFLKISTRRRLYHKAFIEQKTVTFKVKIIY